MADLTGKRILCFGDSLTWGFVPAGGGARYGEDIRWTQQLARLTNATVIEEGLNGRTSVFQDPTAPFCCGADYIEGCVLSQMPLDLVVVMLGTNDMKVFLANGCAGASARGIVAVAGKAAALAGGAPVLVVAPPAMGRFITELPAELGMMEQLDQKSIDGSWQLAGYLRTFCQQMGFPFMDANEFVSASRADAIHMDASGHKAFAEALAARVRELLG